MAAAASVHSVLPAAVNSMNAMMRNIYPTCSSSNNGHAGTRAAGLVYASPYMQSAQNGSMSSAAQMLNPAASAMAASVARYPNQVNYNQASAMQQAVAAAITPFGHTAMAGAMASMATAASIPQMNRPMQDLGIGQSSYSMVCSPSDSMRRTHFAKYACGHYSVNQYFH